MLKRISSYELCQIIEFSPQNLKDFFDAALHIVDHKAVPKFGSIEDSPSFLLDSKDDLDFHTDLQKIVKWRGVNPDLKIADELPTVLQKINFKYNFEIGSTDSLDFHIALSNVKDVTVFTSETL